MDGGASARGCPRRTPNPSSGIEPPLLRDTTEASESFDMASQERGVDETRGRVYVGALSGERAARPSQRVSGSAPAKVGMMP